MADEPKAGYLVTTSYKCVLSLALSSTARYESFIVSKRRPAIATFIDRLPRGASYLVAVSGGKDSMALLDAVIRWGGASRVEVCHIDHRFRHDSADDALFVKEHCKVRGVPCHIAVLAELPTGANLESWARNERYRVLDDCRRATSLDWILTAHTANDVAETFLMRLISNKQLMSIEERDERRRCQRPLLGASRAQIEEYVAQHAVPSREDPSNVDTAFLRNRVRHTLIPHLEANFDPSVVWSLAARAQSVDRDLSVLNDLAKQEAGTVGPVTWSDPTWLASVRARLEALPGDFGWRVVESLFVPVVGYPLGERKGRVVAALLLGEVSSVTLDGGMELHVRQGHLEQNP
jgi:tRNA(Ile)-lysidine synthetase-like protein